MTESLANLIAFFCRGCKGDCSNCIIMARIIVLSLEAGIKPEVFKSEVLKIIREEKKKNPIYESYRGFKAY